MSPISCDAVRDVLPAFVGGDLGCDGTPPVSTGAVRSHLATCTGCRRVASSLQQGRKALQRMGASVPAGVDEDLFARLHDSILAATVRADGGPQPVGSGVGGGAVRARGAAESRRRWVTAIAAAAMFALGFWWVAGERSGSVLDREPLVVDVAAGAGLAVPYAGGRVQMVPLGYEVPGHGDAGSVGQGMAGRLDLRALGDDARLRPVPVVRPGPGARR